MKIIPTVSAFGPHQERTISLYGLSGTPEKESGTKDSNKILLPAFVEKAGERSNRKGRLHQVFVERLPSSINTEVGSMLVCSASSPHHKMVLRVLFLRLLWGRLSEEQFEALLYLALRLQDSTVLEFLKTLNNSKSSLKLIRSRLNALLVTFGIKPYSRRENNSNNNFEIEVVRRLTYAQRHPAKYTGYRRDHNDHGSLRTFTDTDPLPLIPEGNGEDFIIFLLSSALSVGVLPEIPEDKFSLKMSLTNSKQKEFINNLKRFFNE